MLRIFLLLLSLLGVRLLPAQIPGKSLPVRPPAIVASVTHGALVSNAILQRQARRVLALPTRLHKRVKVRELELTLQNIVIDSAFLWFRFRLLNRSHIAFHPAFCRFLVRDRQRSKRMAMQSIELMPYRRPLLGVIGYRRPYDLVVPYLPFTLGPSQRLLIQIGEAKGSRLLLLSVSGKTILHATFLP